MDDKAKNLIRESFGLAAVKADDLVLDFYDRLFVVAPQVRGMFADDISEQAGKLLAVLKLAVSQLDKPEELTGPLHQLGARHAELGVENEHYNVVATVLIDTLAAALGTSWSEEFAAAWSELLEFVAGEMIAGAENRGASVG